MTLSADETSQLASEEIATTDDSFKYSICSSLDSKVGVGVGVEMARRVTHQMS